MLYPAELWALNIGKSDSGETIFLASSTGSGGYYARAYANGKEVWRSLKTKHFSVAESRLAEFLKGHRETRNAQAQASSAKLTFGAAAEIYRSG